eukprot:m.72571 g.72571  ORF g.72571 m.72571 type:complete len:130 (+) comp20267_c0_seq1:519-908(+)
MVPMLHQIFDDFKKDISFVSVYILEAHAADEWPINSPRYKGPKNTINQQTTNDQRRKTAQDFIDTFKFRVPMVCDDISNQFEKHYAPWPLRFYVFYKGKLAYKAQPKDCTYDLEHLCKFLSRFTPKETD